ncbi:MAG TPA: aldo/keto reductase [Phycisphaerae bacterium]|nr:aldo/keto reductase [Phycisphaerae bacterium]HRY67540.1 aldo/keto reductase [Phycisphaerae bacterium]HSA24927.1 aldo/keto reductase [Phycisphaerae bacterium]
MNRRTFLQSAAASAAAFAAGQAESTETTPADEPPSGNAPTLPRREYGQTGIKLSVVGFGGLVVSSMEQKHANRLVAEAVERGVNYFDVAPTYGNAEEVLGPALEPYRKKAFLACKTTQRRRDGAAAELDRSLKRLRTDHFDLYQLHAIADVTKDLDAAFAKGGAMEVFIEARKSGRLRHLGFSAHSIEAAVAAMDRYDFDSVLFPVNFASFLKNDWGPRILEKARAKGVARLALKALARQKWPQDAPDRSKYSRCWYQPLTDRREAELGLRFTLSQPVTAAVSPGEEVLLRMMIELAMNFRPIGGGEEAELKTLAAKLTPVFPTTS